MARKKTHIQQAPEAGPIMQVGGATDAPAADVLASVAAVARHDGGQADSDEQKSYYAVNHQLHSSGQQPFDGIAAWRAAGSPKPRAEAFDWAMMLGVTDQKDFAAAFAALQRLDARVMTLPFDRAGVAPGARRVLTLAWDSERKDWVVQVVATSQ